MCLVHRIEIVNCQTDGDADHADLSELEKRPEDFENVFK